MSKENIPNNRIAITERRQKLWTLLTRGMKGYEIAKELDVDSSTVSRDIHAIGIISNFAISII